MKCISWNVNGLRACVGKGFEEVFRNLDADFFCLQETKLQPGQTSQPLPLCAKALPPAPLRRTSSIKM